MYLRKKSLTRSERLCKRKELKYLFRYGAKVRYKESVLLYTENTFGITRIAVIARKGFQNAVKRNRQKRLAKEAYRHLKQDILSGYDVILFVTPVDYSFKDYVSIEHSLFMKAHMLK